jgi:hypothetical protein
MHEHHSIPRQLNQVLPSMNSLKPIRQAADTGDGDRGSGCAESQLTSLRWWDRRDDTRIYSALVGQARFARCVQCALLKGLFLERLTLNFMLG